MTKLPMAGFLLTPRLLNSSAIGNLKDHFPHLFAGNFDTRQYPDEWHYRPGFSLPNVTREICNGWKSSSTISSIVLNPNLGEAVAKQMGWGGARVAQGERTAKQIVYCCELVAILYIVAFMLKLHSLGADDIIWKPKGGTNTTVGFHRDSEYINVNFTEPSGENAGCTLWIGLDGGSQENGGVQYAVGSQRFGVKGEMTFMASENDDDPVKFLRDALPNEDIVLDTPTVLPGGGLLHHKDVWHGSGANLGKANDRMAIAIHFIDSACEFKESNSKCNSKLPWKNSSYIYGRYRRRFTNELAEEHFPITYNENGKRSDFIDELSAPSNIEVSDVGSEWV